MNKKNKYYTEKFLKIFLVSIVPFSIIAISIFAIYINVNAHTYNPNEQRDMSILSNKDKSENIDKNNKKSIFTPPVRTNVLVVGFDKGKNLTDVIMVLSFVSTTGDIKIMSIPRDTYISYTGDELKSFRNINKYAPSVMKANSIYAYSAKDGMNMLKSTVENILDIKLDYYLKVDLDAFKYIVDSVGGIYFDVPKGGLKYTDPTQNLYINLKEGRQLLDGEAAEGLVRFRKGYARQDLHRVEIQQEFIKEFVMQVMNKDTIMDNLGGIALGAIKYVETDFKITDLPKYISIIPDIKINSIENATLPGYPQSINGVSYYINNKEETRELVDKFFYGNTDPDKVIEKTEVILENTKNNQK